MATHQQILSRRAFRAEHELRRVMDWACGEAYFAVVRGDRIVERLDGPNWSDASKQFRTWLERQA